MQVAERSDELKSSTIGGHSGRTWVDAGALKYLQGMYGIKSMLDVGCGPGGMKDVADLAGIKYLGIDGDASLDLDMPGFMYHDFYFSKLPVLPQQYDLAWSIEFLEHITEQHLWKVMETFSHCKYVLCTASNTPRPHHVNLKDKTYWIDKFAVFGFDYDEHVTHRVLEYSTMKHKNKNKSFLMETGMFFRKQKPS